MRLLRQRESRIVAHVRALRKGLARRDPTRGTTPAGASAATVRSRRAGRRPPNHVSEVPQDIPIGEILRILWHTFNCRPSAATSRRFADAGSAAARSAASPGGATTCPAQTGGTLASFATPPRAASTAAGGASTGAASRSSETGGASTCAALRPSPTGSQTAPTSATAPTPGPLGWNRGFHRLAHFTGLGPSFREEARWVFGKNRDHYEGDLHWP